VKQRLHIYNATHCLREGCDTWSYEPIEHGFVIMIWSGIETAYCSTDCLLLDVAARTAPSEVIGGEGA
jgi:hypothetical protein